MALAPISIRPKTCYDDYLSCHIEKTIADNQTQAIVDSWEINPDKEDVFVNMDYKTKLKAVVCEGDVSQKDYPYKKLISYPYADSKFKCGDYVSFNYGGDIEHWMIYALDIQHSYNVNGRMRKCNNTLNFYGKNGKLVNYPIVYSPQTKANSFDKNASIDIVMSLCKIEIQFNKDTNLIKENDRFILNSIPYKVTSINKHRQNLSSDSMSIASIVIDLERDKESEGDDLANNIPVRNVTQTTIKFVQDDFSSVVGYNGTVQCKINDVLNVSDVKFTSSNQSIVKVYDNGYYEVLANGNCVIRCELKEDETIFDEITVSVVATKPNVISFEINTTNLKVLQGGAKTFTIMKYIDGVASNEMLTLTDISTMPSVYYWLTISENSFIVKNIKQNTNDKVKIGCSDQFGNSDMFEITLGGSW